MWGRWLTILNDWHSLISNTSTNIILKLKYSLKLFLFWSNTNNIVVESLRTSVACRTVINNVMKCANLDNTAKNTYND